MTTGQQPAVPNTPSLAAESQPTVDGAATQHNAPPGLDTIAAKMTAMREAAQRNRQGSNQTDATAAANSASPEAPTHAVEPEVATSPDEDNSPAEQLTAQDDVTDSDTQPVSSDTDSSSQDIIDFIEFAETNPNAKFRFTRNGKPMVIDARKAAAILGQGGAIHEEARELKIQRSEFEEYERTQRQHMDGLTLAMEFTIQPQMQQAYDEIVRTQGYQATFQQQLATTQDPAQQARIRASMQQNEQYIQQQGELIRSIKPRIDQFQAARQQQVSTVLEHNRKAFKDRELRNEFVFNEIRDRVAKDWPSARTQLVPGIDNIDLIASDEHILSLVRDGLKYRDRPTAKASGASVAQLTRAKNTTPRPTESQDISALRERARGGDTKAADNLLVAQLNRIRAGRR